MRTYLHSLAIIASLIVAGCFTLALAQQSADRSQQAPPNRNKPPQLTLGDSDGTPGSTIVVPIYFAPAEGIEVGELKVNINFVSRSLKYSRLNRGLAAEMGNVNVRAELKEGKNDKGLEVSTVNFEASIPSPKPGQKGIPGGLLGYLTLQVSEKSGPANITLRATGQAEELGTHKSLPNFKTVDAKVDILAAGSEPLISCFFFTH